MTVIKETKKKSEVAKHKRRYQIHSELYNTEYTNYKLMAYVHYYGQRMLFGGAGQIIDTQYPTN